MKARVLVVLVLVLLLASGACVRSSDPASETLDTDAPQLGTPPDLSIQRSLPTTAPGRNRSFAVVTAPERSTEPALDAALVRAGTISGSVLDPASQAMEGVCAKARDIVTGAFAAGDLTDENGRFGIKVDPARYELLVDAGCGPGAGTHTSAYYGGSDPVVLDVRSSGERDIDVVLKPKGRLVGTITDQLAIPLAGACVLAQDVRDAAVLPGIDLDALDLTTTTGSFDGLLDEGWYVVRFSVCGLPVGSPLFQPEYFENATRVADATPVFVQAGQTKSVTVDLIPEIVVP